MNITNNNRCISCGGLLFKEKFPDTTENYLFNGIQFKYIECETCKLIFSNPIPDKETISKFYTDSYGYEYFKKISIFKSIQGYFRFIKIIKHFEYGSAKLLDFGCGHGYFVKSSSKFGVKSFGFDLGISKIINESDYSLHFSENFQSFKETEFDVITAWHVLEHMSEPDETILELSERLKANGILIIAVPNSDSISFKINKEKWNWFQQPFSHIYHFNEKNLSKLLEKKGFQIKFTNSYFTWDSNLYDIIVSFLLFKNKQRSGLKIQQGIIYDTLIYLDSFFRTIILSLSILWKLLFLKKNQGSELIIVAKKI